MVENVLTELTEDEAERYDRQIRLWGMEAQRRIRASKILIIGMNGLGAETAKNIILSGVKSVRLLDNECLSELDFYSQFLVPQEDLGKNRAEASLPRARALNPLVEVTAETKPFDELPDDFFIGYNVVCATGLKLAQLERINKICRDNSQKFICGDVWGVFGYMFEDLLDHKFSHEVTTLTGPKKRPLPSKEKKDDKVVVQVVEYLKYVPLKDALAVDWSLPQNKKRLNIRRGDPSFFVMKTLMKFREDNGRDPDPDKREQDIDTLLKIRNDLIKDLTLPESFVKNELFHDVFGTVAASSAIIGGIIGQEIVKAVSLKEYPHNNFFFFNPLKFSGFVECYGMKKESI